MANGKKYQLNLALSSFLIVGLILLFYFTLAPYLLKVGADLISPDKAGAINSHLFWLLAVACPFFILLNLYFGLVELRLKQSEEELTKEQASLQANQSSAKWLLVVKKNRRNILKKTEILLIVAMALVLAVVLIDFLPLVINIIESRAPVGPEPWLPLKPLE